MSEQERLAFWTKAVNLAEFRVVHERRDTPSDPVRFTVVPRQEVGVCPACGHASDSVHRRHDSSPIKDLPLSEQPVDLISHFCRVCRNNHGSTPISFLTSSHVSTTGKNLLSIV